jgi:oligopeptide/dipeptide ABC transporter ATP-binding protein
VSAVREQKQAAAAAVASLLDVRGLRIERVRPGRRDTIVSSLSLRLDAGETVGIVGESGSGKSMTARAIIGLLPPTLVASGEVVYGGRNLIGAPERQWRQVRGREIGLILQDPFTMLNPVIRCGRILEESFAGERRLSRAERRSEAIRRLVEVGIRDESVVDRYPFQLSGGMRQRVGIAAALARDPKLLIADEPSTALDVTTQREILALLRRIQEARGMGLILITHDLRVAFAMCDRIQVLYAGSVLEVGPSADLEREPMHPYSEGLLLSEPRADQRVSELVAIAGSVPAADEVAGVCAFSPRCAWAEAICREKAPPLREVSANRSSACVRVEEIREEMVARRVRARAEAATALPERPVPSLIDVRTVEKVFVNGTRRVNALEGVSLTVGENETVGLVGESGSGKTTLARLLVGLEAATGGEVLIDGIDASNWSKLSSRDRRRLRRIVQIVFQDPYSSLNPMRTVGSTLSEAITTHDPHAKRVRDQITDLLGSVGLPAGYAGRKPVALSGGERQRVAIARALAAAPRMLICDEPVSALDVSVQAQILNLFSAFKRDRGIGYLFITHDLSIVRQITEYVYVMHRGRIVEAGPVESVLDNPRDAYTQKLLASVASSDAGWLTTPVDEPDRRDVRLGV